MELPRIASHTSICPTPSLQLMLTDYGQKNASIHHHQAAGGNTTPAHSRSNSSSRVPASKKLLSSSVQQQQQQQSSSSSAAEPQFAILPSSSHYQPSRRREEACALQNLRRRLQAVRVMQANKPEPIEALMGSCRANNNSGGSPVELDNSRPLLLQKILSNRPVSMVLDISDLTTAWKDSDFITDCLCWHNVYRQRHGSPPLSMCSELCYLAQTWANHLAHTNRFYYRNDKDIGQNLFCRPSNPLVTDVTGQEVATYWYSAVRQYDFRKEPDILHANVNAGHFTQLVWAASRHFGVGKARSRSGKIVVVAHYAPTGNSGGSYLENVLPPSSEYFTLPSVSGAGRRFAVDNSVGSSTSESGRSVSGST